MLFIVACRVAGIEYVAVVFDLDRFVKRIDAIDQLATLLATDLIIGLCNLASLDTRVSTSDDEIEVCGPIGGPLIWTIAQSGPWLVVGGAIGSPTD